MHSNSAGLPGRTVYPDSNLTGSGPFFRRLGVQN
jgi:hypothetical protein